MTTLEQVASTDDFAQHALKLMEVFSVIRLGIETERELSIEQLSVCRARITKDLEVAVMAPTALVTSGRLQLSDFSIINETNTGTLIVNVSGAGEEVPTSTEMELYRNQGLECALGLVFRRHMEGFYCSEPDANGNPAEAWVVPVRDGQVIHRNDQFDPGTIVMLVGCSAYLPEDLFHMFVGIVEPVAA